MYWLFKGYKLGNYSPMKNKIVVKLKSFMPNPFIYCVIAEEIISSTAPVKLINKP